MNDRITQKVLAIIAEHSTLSPTEIPLDKAWHTFAAIDSLITLRIIVSLEKEFSISFHNDDLNHVFTDVNHIVTSIKEKLS